MESDSDRKIIDIPIELLDEHPDNSTIFNINNEELTELAVSIKAIGVQQPLLVEAKEDGRYTIIAGHRRKRAAEMINRKTVPCVIKQDDIDTETILVETNLRIRELSLMDKARAVRYAKKRLAIRRGKPYGNSDTMSELEKLFNESSRNLNRYDKLNDLIPELQAMVEGGSIGLVLGVRLAGLDKEVQQELYEYLGDAIKDIGPEDIKLLRQQNDRGYLVLEVMQKKINNLEAELEERRRKDGDIEVLEKRIQFLQNKKKTLEYDLSDYVNAAERAREQILKNGAALVSIVEELTRPIAGARPKIEALLETPLEPATATHLVKWSQVLIEIGQRLEAAAKKALVIQGSISGEKEESESKKSRQSR
jgi:ParB family chromosome partitioning protein